MGDKKRRRGAKLGKRERKRCRQIMMARNSRTNKRDLGPLPKARNPPIYNPRQRKSKRLSKYKNKNKQINKNKNKTTTTTTTTISPQQIPKILRKRKKIRKKRKKSGISPAKLLFDTATYILFAVFLFAALFGLDLLFPHPNAIHIPPLE